MKERKQDIIYIKSKLLINKGFIKLKEAKKTHLRPIPVLRTSIFKNSILVLYEPLQLNSKFDENKNRSNKFLCTSEPCSNSSAFSTGANIVSAWR